MSEPHNLGKGWVGFDFKKAFGCPVKVINDAAMQALGGGNAKHLRTLPAGVRLGSNAYAFTGGYRLWAKKTRGWDERLA